MERERRDRQIWFAFVACLVVGAGVRLLNLDAPIIGMHSWRQADTAAIARNFHEFGYHFFLPQIDWGGATHGYVESEFPIFPFTVAVLYGALGVHEWIGRFAAVTAFLVGAIALFDLTRRAIDLPTAMWSFAFYLFLPLNIFYSRAFMPEPWMISASVLGIYWFYRWTQDDRTSHLAIAATFVTLAALLKLPALYLGLPLAWMGWSKYKSGAIRRGVLWAVVVAVLVPVAAWYFHAHQILERGGQTFGVWEYGSDKWGNWALVASWEFWNGVIFRSLAERWFTWAAFAVLIVGIFLPRRARDERLFDAWLLAALVYVVIVARGNYVHEYYQLPFLPVGVVYIGKVFARHWGSTWRTAPRALLALCLVVTAGLSASRLGDYLRREDPSRSREIALGREIRERTEPNALVVAVQEGNPTLLYHAHRKGWSISQSSVTESSLRELHAKGARYVVSTQDFGPPAGHVEVYRGQHGYIARIP